jgi:hypothetical protein
MKSNFLLFASLFALTAAAGAENPALTQNTLTNHDIVVLAQAGFNESFLADLIAMSRTRFDTSVAGLAELAKEGLTERLIRVMLMSSVPPQTGNLAAPLPDTSPAATAVVPAAVIALPIAAKRRSRRKTDESATAIANQAPYYQSSSIMWGLWKRKTGVGVGLHPGKQPVDVQLGTAYTQVLRNAEGSGNRYVVLP